MIKDYLLPTSLEEAVAMLKEKDGRARIIAGGTDLTLDIKKMDSKPDYLVDLKNVEELKQIEDAGDCIKVGGNVTFTACLANELLSEHASALAMAAANIGAVQVRNMGTLAGNIVSAQPAADAAVAMTALDVVCVVVGPQGEREVPIVELYAGVGKSNVDSTREILAFIKIPKRAACSNSAYVVMDQRNALALPMVCTAVRLDIADGIVADARVVAAPLSPGPTCVKEAEAFLVGKPATAENYEAAGKIATESVSFRSSLVRGSSAYRHEVLPILIRRALLTAESGIR